MSAKYLGIQVKYQLNILCVDILQKRHHQTIIGLTLDRGPGENKTFK